MKALCINSSGNEAEVCLIDDDITLRQVVESPHSEKLMVAVDQLLNEHNLQVMDFDCFCAVVGPGSFTGVRIAVAIIKGMCVINRHAKIVSLTNFDLVASNVKNQKNFLVVLESGNDDKYVAEYRDNCLIKIFHTTAKDLNKHSDENNLPIFANVIESDNLKNIKANFVQLQPSTLATLCKEKIRQNQTIEINELSPVYIKQSQAEKARAEKILSQLTIKKTHSCADLLAIENACFTTTAWTKEIFEEELEKSYKTYLIAKIGTENIAYIGYEQVGNMANIQKVAVLQDYRNCGVASKLVKKVIEDLKNNKCEKIMLEVNVNNKPAIQLYEKMGFVKISKRDNYYKNGDSCFVMQIDDINK